jgi:dihydroflavonol-4-reductase
VKALVTGATGFVGSHLVERLLREGVEVACLVRPTSSLAHLEGLDVERRVATLEDPEALERAVEGAELVFHCAGLTRARSLPAYAAANVAGTQRLLHAVAQQGRTLRRFVYVSSLAAVGPCPSDEPFDERTVCLPRDAYGATKLAAERAVLAELKWLPGVVVRPPAVYGPRDRNFLPLFRMARRFGLAPVIGSPAKQLTLVHAADLADCLWRAATVDAAEGQAYFVGSGTHTWSEVLDALAEALGKRLRRMPIPALWSEETDGLGFVF